MSHAVEGHETLNDFIQKTAAGCRTISFVGFEKGSGKTTAFKAFLSALDSKTIGITSMGSPAVGSINTPGDYPVYVPAGTIVATTQGALGMCDTTREILHTTGIQTPTGEVIVFRAISAGNVFLAGPSIIADSIKVRDLFFEAGAEVVLIDSAADRKSAAYPAHADGVVVTGRVTRTAGKAHEDWLNQELDTLLTPDVEDQDLLKLLQDNLQSRCPFFVVDEHHGVLHAPEGECKDNIASLIKDCPKNIKAIMIKGALTKSSILPVVNLSGQMRKKIHGAIIAAEDPAKIFLDIKHRQSLEGLGLRLRVLRAAKILALCLNPSQQGLNREQISESLRVYSARLRLPVMDVVGGTYLERV